MADLVVAGVSVLVEPSTCARTIVPTPVRRLGLAVDHEAVRHG